MTTSRAFVLSAVVTFALPSAQAMAADGWGASWSFGPVHPTTTNHIIHTKTTLVPGRSPVSYWSSSSVGPLFLWPGISNPTSALIQTTMDAWSGTENSSYCGATGGQWCVEASIFNGGQINGPTVAIDPDDHVTIDYELGADNNTWTQTVTSQKLGKVVSTLKSASGLMLGGGFGFATEADANSFTVDTAYYLCTEVHLAAADPAFGATGVGGVGAQYGATGTGSGIGTATNLHTPDNGLTWLVDLITLPAMNPQGTQTPRPTYNCSSGSSSSSSSSSSSGASSSRGSSSGTSSGRSSSSSSSTSSGASSSTGASNSIGGTSSIGSASSGGFATGIGGASGIGGGASSVAGGGGTGGGSSAGGTASNANGCSCELERTASNERDYAQSAVVALGIALLGVARKRRRGTR